MYSKKSLVLLILLISLSLLFTGCSQNSSESPSVNEYSVSGEVVDFNGEGVENVKVMAENEGKVATTDANGKWQLSDLSGEVNLVAKKESYIFKPHSEKVTGEKEVDFKLESETDSGAIDSEGKTQLTSTEKELKLNIEASAVTEEGNNEIPKGMNITGNIGEEYATVVASDPDNNYLPEVVVKKLPEEVQTSGEIKPQFDPFTLTSMTMLILKTTGAAATIGGVTVGTHMAITSANIATYKHLQTMFLKELSKEGLTKSVEKLTDQLGFNPLIVYIATEDDNGEILNSKKIRIVQDATKTEIKEVLQEELGDNKEIKELKFPPKNYEHLFYEASGLPKIITLSMAYVENEEDNDNILSKKVDKIMAAYNETVDQSNDAVEPYLDSNIYHHYEKSKNEYLEWLKDLKPSHDNYSLVFWDISHRLENEGTKLIIEGKFQENMGDCYYSGTFEMYLRNTEGVWKIYEVHPSVTEEYCPETQGQSITEYKENTLFSK